MRKFILALFVGVFALNSASQVCSEPAQTLKFQPLILNEILKTASQHRSTKPPAIIFDLDDTLFYSKTRELSILREFISQPEIAKTFAEEVRLTSLISMPQHFYTVEETLAAAGIQNQNFIQLARKFWSDRFFTNAYVEIDEPVIGAVRFVQALRTYGIEILYVSGRDIPGMKAGTEKSLRAHGFPLDEGARVILKPEPKTNDLVFKKEIFKQIADQYEVIAAFENEPANANAYLDAFPGATVVLLDTAHSHRPDLARDEVIWIKDYLGIWDCKKALPN